MDSRIRLLTKHLKGWDRDLFASRMEDGSIHISRYHTYWVPFEFDEKKFLYAKQCPVFVIALTDNWLVTGKPVDWGIEPLMRKIMEMDQWRDDSMYDNLVKDRERKEENRKREFRNNVKALAYDLRTEFAKATNDINTSLLAKTDKRRLKDGHC